MGTSNRVTVTRVVLLRDCVQVDYGLISATCNMFRALSDVYDSFYSVQSMIDYFSRDYYNMSAYARPGAWNDPDQVGLLPRRTIIILFMCVLYLPKWQQ